MVLFLKNKIDENLNQNFIDLHLNLLKIGL